MANARFITLVGLIMVSLGAVASHAERPGPVTQPEKIPSDWEMGELKFPSVDWVKKQPTHKPVYGIYSWTGEYRKLREEMNEVGWTTIRLGGQWDDQVMKMVIDDELEILRNQGVGKRDEFESDEAFLEAGKKNVGEFLSRYGPGGSFFKGNPEVAKRPIEHIELGNEPNFQYMIDDEQGVGRVEMEARRFKLYGKVIPSDSKTIKADWPSVRIAAFAAGGAASSDVRFIRAVHQAHPNIVQRYDILSTHPYTSQAPPEALSVHSWGKYNMVNNLAKIRDILAKQEAKDKPIWYTEVGWKISGEDGGKYKQPMEAPVSPLLQAAYTTRLYALAVRTGVRRVTPMFITDTDGFNGGFMTPQGQWRPAAFATQTMIDLMPHPKLQKVIRENKDGVFVYQFDPDAANNDTEQSVTMAWRVQGPKQITVPWSDEQARVIDLFGHEKQVEAQDGSLKIDLGPAPVYLDIGQ